MTILAALAEGAAETPSPIKDIAPPVDLPIPLWWIVVGTIVALLVLGALIFLIHRVLSRSPGVVLSPRMLALRELEKLRAQVNTLEPYAFSIAVSDTLRSYIGSEHRLHALQQTSPEFLSSIAQSNKFTDSDRQLLGEFLERCDMIKFARVSATTEDSARLLQSAVSFVQGVRA
ncbi:MAG TPA: DUF4381 family protein [Chthoniobacteraceae bacterium]|jgi:hypothetical protein